MTDRERLLDELRPVAFAIAYRMLGSVSEAEDVVQEALLRVHQALDAGERIASPRAFVATVTTRLAINELRSARARRERYVGEWLPEPIITDGDDDPAQHAETADSLSLAMLVLLESLSPEQRARARTMSVSSQRERDATSSSAGPASERRASTVTSWHDSSFRPPSKAISVGSRRCSLTTWS
jgi:RNA polymerase sigma factor (sigma-70 family)